MANSFKSATFKVVADDLRFSGMSYDFVLPRGEYSGHVEYYHLMMRGREVVQEAKMMIPLTRAQIVDFRGVVSPNFGDLELNVLPQVRRGDIECHVN